MSKFNFQALSVYTAPATEPVTTAEAKAHLRVDISTDDTLIGLLVTAARQHLETICGRALVTQTLDVQFDRWPDGSVIYLPRAPLQSITSITYSKADASTGTLSSSDYVVDIKSQPGRVLLKSAASWPSDELQVGAAVTVRFVAGYGAAAAVPQPLKQAILLLVGHWYENREAVIDTGRKTLLPLPMAVNSLIYPYRIWGI